MPIAKEVIENFKNLQFTNFPPNIRRLFGNMLPQEEKNKFLVAPHNLSLFHEMFSPCIKLQINTANDRNRGRIAKIQI